ncbi:T9SS type A sorting domain-containing protein [Gaetbulibacter aestuarii]|uniref:T9SS type A sorting domain-containing protein n=1 Tax=Gaetbulibacter aestuarii TaxID=1502358 RepID=A0ABW7MZ05_9FLAO
MKKNYFYIFLFSLFFLTSLNGFSQTNPGSGLPQEKIEGLTIYPNPVSYGQNTVHITSKYNGILTVAIFNVLGKQIASHRISSKTLDVTNLSKGVYVLKISENNISEVRKLVIK